MSESAELTASVRERVGKGSARALRREGKVPAVIYGDKKPPLPIAIPYKEAFMRLHAGGFLTSIMTLDVDGEKHRVIPKDYQLDPVRDFLEHVDFLRVSRNTTVTVDIPVNFLNEDTCPGLKAGGALNIVRYTVEVVCRADSIPDSIEVDLGEMNIGDSAHISAVTLPEGVEPTIRDRDFTIATIASPAGYSDSAEDDEEGEGEETAEGEEPEAES
ncbi:MAG: 50S ribosomal protein L25/general stress protein Ctc [Pseudomonadota bacterium]